MKINRRREIVEGVFFLALFLWCSLSIRCRFRGRRKLSTLGRTKWNKWEGPVSQATLEARWHRKHERDRRFWLKLSTFSEEKNKKEETRLARKLCYYFPVFGFYFSVFFDGFLSVEWRINVSPRLNVRFLFSRLRKLFRDRASNRGFLLCIRKPT